MVVKHRKPAAFANDSTSADSFTRTAIGPVSPGLDAILPYQVEYGPLHAGLGVRIVKGHLPGQYRPPLLFGSGKLPSTRPPSATICEPLRLPLAVRSGGGRCRPAWGSGAKFARVPASKTFACTISVTLVHHNALNNCYDCIYLSLIAFRHHIVTGFDLHPDGTCRVRRRHLLLFWNRTQKFGNSVKLSYTGLGPHHPAGTMECCLLCP